MTHRVEEVREQQVVLVASPEVWVRQVVLLEQDHLLTSDSIRRLRIRYGQSRKNSALHARGLALALGVRRPGWT